MSPTDESPDTLAFIVPGDLVMGRPFRSTLCVDGYVGIKIDELLVTELILRLR